MTYHIGLQWQTHTLQGLCREHLVACDGRQCSCYQHTNGMARREGEREGEREREREGGGEGGRERGREGEREGGRGRGREGEREEGGRGREAQE